MQWQIYFCSHADGYGKKCQMRGNLCLLHTRIRLSLPGKYITLLGCGYPIRLRYHFFLYKTNWYATAGGYTYFIFYAIVDPTYTWTARQVQLFVGKKRCFHEPCHSIGIIIIPEPTALDPHTISNTFWKILRNSGGEDCHSHVLNCIFWAVYYKIYISSFMYYFHMHKTFLIYLNDDIILLKYTPGLHV